MHLIFRPIIRTRTPLALVESPTRLQATQALQLYQRNSPRHIASSEKDRALGSRCGSTSSARSKIWYKHLDDIIRRWDNAGEGVRALYVWTHVWDQSVMLWTIYNRMPNLRYYQLDLSEMKTHRDKCSIPAHPRALVGLNCYGVLIPGQRKRDKPLIRGLSPFEPSLLRLLMLLPMRGCTKLHIYSTLPFLL